MPDTTKPTIWALFSASADDPARFEFRRWWSVKPSIRELGEKLATPLSTATDTDIARLARVWEGETVRFDHLSAVFYKLQSVREEEWA